MYAYKSRSDTLGRKPWVMNVEELATLWHFPVVTVKASQVQIIESKKSAPPTRLPYHSRVAPTPVADRTPRIAPVKPMGPLDDYSSDSASEINVEPVTSYSRPVAPPKPLSVSNPQFSNIESSPANIPNPNNNTKGAPPSNLPFV